MKNYESITNLYLLISCRMPEGSVLCVTFTNISQKQGDLISLSHRAPFAQYNETCVWLKNSTY